MQQIEQIAMLNNYNVRIQLLFVLVIYVMFGGILLTLDKVWLRSILSPVSSHTYIKLYFLLYPFCLMFVALCLTRLDSLPKRLASTFFLCVTYSFLLSQLAAFFHYSDYLTIIGNSHSIAGTGYFILVFFVFGGFKSFLLGDWIAGVVTLLLLSKAKDKR